jgi:HD-GYP domain-containing protein (c-di-GMP phosphodiesterase class II)
MATAELPFVAEAAPAPAVDDNEMVEQARASLRRNLQRRDRRVVAFIAAAFVAAATTTAIAFPNRPLSIPALVVGVVVYALASRIEFEIGSGSALPTQLLLVPLLFALPVGIIPFAVAAGLVLGRVPDLARGRLHPDRIPLLLVNSWHAVGPAVVLGVAGATAHAPHWRQWPLYTLALGAQFGCDVASSLLRNRLTFGTPLFEHVRLMAHAFAVDAALAPIGLAFAIAGGKYAVLAGLPLMGLLKVFARERQVRIDHALELSQAYRGTAFLLGDVIEADDEYTGSHSRDVVDLSRAVGQCLGLEQRELRKAELTALLHDVGKIKIPSEIINKPERLTPEERAIIETHTLEGERLLARVGGLLAEVGTIVRSCHERWDGLGYPDRLAGEDIPLVARIVCCCDAFNAMTTDRPYRAARSTAEAVAEVERCSGTHFDPAVAAALAAVVRGGMSAVAA